MTIKYEIYQLSSNPSNSTLRIYKQVQPVCDIYEEELYECLSDNQIKQWENGKFEFSALPITKIREHSIKNYFLGY